MAGARASSGGGNRARITRQDPATPKVLVVSSHDPRVSTPRQSLKPSTPSLSRGSSSRMRSKRPSALVTVSKTSSVKWGHNWAASTLVSEFLKAVSIAWKQPSLAKVTVWIVSMVISPTC
ncbi:hypothetical protein FOZG_18488 [Fusarium oxysporum Fo47]|uniref:Uncharacterized protein n=1 Tax=Fusarium oxysporum Fo47 TaxID=660027 RepID=W9JDR1_FUSOX|nr:hypothetical protein FOZG_18488 [Fusarium oxysporum Fo47]